MGVRLLIMLVYSQPSASHRLSYVIYYLLTYHELLRDSLDPQYIIFIEYINSHAICAPPQIHSTRLLTFVRACYV